MCVPSVNMTKFLLFGKNCKTFDITEWKMKPSSHHFFILAVIVNNRPEYAT
jgi:hypothetical protein